MRKAGKEYAVQRAAEFLGEHVWAIHRDMKKTGCLLCGPEKPCPVNEPFSYARWEQRREADAGPASLI